MFLAILAGLGGCLGWGLADFFAKKTIDELGDVMTLAWAGVFGTAAFAVAAWVGQALYDHSITVPDNASTWLILAFFGTLQGAVYIFVYRGFAKGRVGLLSPVFASFAGLVALISILFLGEQASSLRIIALLITFAGVLALNADFDALSSLRLGWNHVDGFFDVFIATLLAALWTVLWELFVSGKDWLSYAAYMFAFMTIAVFIFAGYRKLPFSVQQRRLWKFIAAIGICETVAYLAITLGYGATPFVSVVAVLSAAFSLPTMLLARLFLNENFTRHQALAALTIVFGAILLAVV